MSVNGISDRASAMLWNEDRLLDDLPESGHTAMCIGAHEGQWAQRLSPVFNRVIAIEPNPANIATLSELQLGNLEIVEAAAWMTSGGMLPFHVREHQTMSGALACRDICRDSGVTSTLDVQVVTIDQFELTDLDFLMVDTEGAELDVIRGGTFT